MSSEVLITLEIYVMVLQPMTSCSLGYRYNCFRETYCMCLQGRRYQCKSSSFFTVQL